MSKLIEGLEYKAEVRVGLKIELRSHGRFLNRKVASEIFRCFISIMLHKLLGLIKIWSKSCLHVQGGPHFDGIMIDIICFICLYDEKLD